MKDPHIHVEKDLLFTHAQMRELIVEAIGLACDMPKTVATGCNRRRPYAMTSTMPAKVTCLACREYAARQHEQQAETAESLMSIPADHDIWITAKTTPAMLGENAREHREMAAIFKAMP